VRACCERERVPIGRIVHCDRDINDNVSYAVFRIVRYFIPSTCANGYRYEPDPWARLERASTFGYDVI